MVYYLCACKSLQIFIFFLVTIKYLNSISDIIARDDNLAKVMLRNVNKH